MNVVWLVIFWIMQAVAALAFKWGSTSDGRWLTGFIGGNVVGASSIWFMMMLYKTMNANVAMGLAVGGGFLIAQVAIALAFKSSLTLVQFGGLIAITLGMYFLSTGGAVR